MNCRICGKKSFTDYCFQHKPRTALATKPMKKIGKVTSKWIATRQEWLAANPPDQYGYYYCAICGLKVDKDKMVLDHDLARSRRPDLRNTMENLNPAHALCNWQKGSLSLKEFKDKLNNSL